jgi:hypothetical protein
LRFAPNGSSETACDILATDITEYRSAFRVGGNRVKRAKRRAARSASRLGGWFGALAVFLQTMVPVVYGPAALAGELLASDLAFAVCSEHAERLDAARGSDERDHDKHVPPSSGSHTCPICFSLAPAGNATGPGAFADVAAHAPAAPPHDLTSVRPELSEFSFGTLPRGPPALA